MEELLLIKRIVEVQHNFLYYIAFKANADIQYNFLEALLNLLPCEARQKHRRLRKPCKFVNGLVYYPDLSRVDLSPSRAMFYFYFSCAILLY